MQILTVQDARTKLQLLNEDLQYSIQFEDSVWTNETKKPKIYFYGKLGRKYVPIPLSFHRAKHRQHVVEGKKIISTFSGFSLLGKALRLKLTATAEILSDGNLDFSLHAEQEGEKELHSILYPAPFNRDRYSKESSYSFDPYRQGFLLPDTHAVNRKAIFLLTKYSRKINTGDAYLPLWGRVCGTHGYCAYADESYDAALQSSYGKRSAFLTGIKWLSSLGQLSYDRILHIRFQNGMDYVKAAKAFRKQEQAKGKLVTLDEKIKANPQVAYLIGAPIIHWSLLEHNEKGSKIYKQTKIYEKIHNTFDESAQAFQTFKDCGLKKAYIHCDGWGNRGYDNLHPYVLPPSEKIGGYAGMRRLSDTCRQLDYKFGLHDQYRDFYQDSPVYDVDKCITDINGKRPDCDIWAGGAHHYLCTSFAKAFVQRTYDELAANKVQIDGAYLDVFGISSGDECFHPAHPLTRRQSIEARGACFDLLRQRGIIVSSEELGCQMVQYLDLLHHAPYGVTPQGGGQAIGVPIPLANLVYHDCVFVPWLCDGKGGWGIPDGDSGKLHCILNAQSPYFNNSMQHAKFRLEKEALKQHIAQVQEIAAIEAKLYRQELINHEFLDDTFRVQRTTFADGTKITVNFQTDTYRVDFAEPAEP